MKKKYDFHGRMILDYVDVYVTQNGNQKGFQTKIGIQKS